MPTFVRNTNIASLITQHELGRATKQVSQSMERLSSGLRINRSADDAAGLAISQGLESQIKKMSQALRNAQDGIGTLQIADGALSIIGDSLQRVRELTVQAANDSYSTTMRNAIAGEITQIVRDIDRIASSTQFNGINLLSGTATNSLVQIGPNSATSTNTVDLSPAFAASGSGDPGGPGGLGLFTGTTTFANLTALNTTGLTSTNSLTFLNDIDTAITNLNLQRSKVGAFQNQLENVTQNLMSSVENISDANSRIRDVDVADESSKLTQFQILQNASVNILGQTNKIPQMIMGLLDARG